MQRLHMNREGLFLGETPWGSCIKFWAPQSQSPSIPKQGEGWGALLWEDIPWGTALSSGYLSIGRDPEKLLRNSQGQEGLTHKEVMQAQSATPCIPMARVSLSCGA